MRNLIYCKKSLKQLIITSGELTGSSSCIRFKISATRTDAFPLALTFGITPKKNCNALTNTLLQANCKHYKLDYIDPY